MHLLLLLPSSILLALLFFHSWRYRGKAVTVAFFVSCFAFGVIRGNLIHYICNNYLGEETLPYLFVRPAAKVWNASLQECIGWIFALYLCWSTVEWLLARQGKHTVPLYRLLGLAGFFMGCVAYAVEAAAGGVKWWIWVLPIKNPFFADVPLAGIIAWISVVFDFLAPFLLIYYKAFRNWWSKSFLFCLFPIHMFLHTKESFNVDWLPMLGPSDIWHWLIICLLVWGIAVGGPEITPWTSRVRKEEGEKSWLRHGVFVTLAGFILVLGTVHFFIMDGSGLVVTMVPFVICVLFFNPIYAWLFCLVACVLIGFTTGGWSYTLVPLLVSFIFTFGSRWFSGLLSLLWRKRVALTVLLLSTMAIYLFCQQRNQHNDELYKLGASIIKAGTGTGLESLLARLPSPPEPEDAGIYNLLAEQAFQSENYPAAQRFLEKAIECDSSDAYVFSNLAIIYYLKGDYGAAISAYEKGLSNNPINYDSYLILGQIYQGLDSLRKAERLYRRALKYYQNNTTIKQALESILQKQNRIDDTLELHQSSVPESADSIR